MQKKRSDIEKALADKGFTLEETHHRYYKLYVNGKFTGISTYVSTGSNYKDYGNSLLGSMARQLKLSKQELCDLIDCPMDEEQYKQILREKHFL